MKPNTIITYTMRIMDFIETADGNFEISHLNEAEFQAALKYHTITMEDAGFWEELEDGTIIRTDII